MQIVKRLHIFDYVSHDTKLLKRQNIIMKFTVLFIDQSLVNARVMMLTPFSIFISTERNECLF